MDCNHKEEEELSEQMDDQLIESCVKRALEYLNISEDKEDNELATDGQTVSQSDNQLDDRYEDRVDDQTDREDIPTSDEISVESNVWANQSMATTTGAVHKKFKTETNTGLSDIEDEDQKIVSQDKEAIGESAAQTEEESDSCEGQTASEVTESEINYVNAILNVSSGNPVTNRYPLKYQWQLWFWRADQGIKVVWHQALQRVCKPFETIEDFWRLYNHIICVQHLVPPSDYCVFKSGIMPMWEDCHNINGGKWVLEFAKGDKRECNPHLDEIWLEVLLCLIGEGFNEYSEEICGAVVNIRSKEDRISVWTANADKSVANLKIGEILKTRTGFEGKMKYEAHSTSQKIAEAKDRLFDTRLYIKASKENSKPTRRSCIF